MCTVLSALGTAATVYSGYAQGKTAKAHAYAQASAMDYNAEVARQQAHDSILRGGEEELRLRRQLAQHRGNQRAILATSGADIDSGSALDAQNASIAAGEYDANVIRFNAARQRWGYLNEADNLNTQAANTRAIGRANYRNALFGGIVNGGLYAYEGYEKYRGTQATSSPLTDRVDDRSKYWGPVYNPIERRRRGY